MTATPSLLRMVWDSRYGQDLAADIVRKPRRTDESHSEIEAWGVVKAPAGKSYRVACYRSYDRTAERGARVTWDCAVYIGAGKGSRMAPESVLQHVRAFALQMFRRAVEACASADWDCGDARWPAREPAKALVADYAEAVRDLAAVAEMEGANISGETLAFNQRNAADHAEVEADSTGLFDFAATDSAIAWARIHAGEGRARSAGFRCGKAPRDFDNPHMEGTGHAVAWDEGYQAGLAAFRNETMPELTQDNMGREPAEELDSVPVVRRDNVEYHAGRDAWAANQTKDSNPYQAGGERAARWDLGWQEACDKGAPVRTIDCTPTWAAILPALLAAVTDGTAEGQRIAREELARMATIADSYVAAQKALRDAN